MKEKIKIENRPDLSQKDIEQGMNFSKIKSNSILIKKAAAKMVFVKTVVATLILSSAIFTYTILNKRKSDSIAPNKIPTTIQTINDSLDHEIKNDTTANTAKIVDLNKPETVSNFKQQQSLHPFNEKKIDGKTPLQDSVFENNSNKPVQLDTVSKSVDEQKIDNTKEHSQNVVARQDVTKNSSTQCRIWKSNNYCDIPSSARMVKKFDCIDCTLYDVKCEELNKDEKIHAVWVTLNVSGNSIVILKSKFENVTLINSQGKEIHPFFVALTKGDMYLACNSKMKALKADFEKKIDIILFFGEATIGDQIKLDHFPIGVITE